MDLNLNTSGVLALVVGLLMAIGLSITIRYLLHGRRFELHESGKRHVLRPSREFMGESDQDASFSSEMIEGMVKEKLATYPDLRGITFDFRTATGGMLEIVFDERTYQNVDQIPDERVREAIDEAVAEFNRREM